MESRLLRRSLATAAVAAAATVAASLPGVALAATTKLGAPTFSPADGSVVHDSRPQITVTYNTALDPGTSTLTVTDTTAKTTVGCPTALSSDHTALTCRPSAPLPDGHTVTVAAHAVNAADSTDTRDDSTPKGWTTDLPPVLQGGKGSPIAGGSVANGGEVLTAQFNKGVTGSTNPSATANGTRTAAFQVYEVHTDGSRGSYLPAKTITFGVTDPVTKASDGTVSYTPTGPLTAGEYEADLVVSGVDSTGAAEPGTATTASYRFWVDTTGVHADGLATAAPVATNANNTAFAFTGYAAPGLDVTVSVPGKDTTPLHNAKTVTGTARVAPCAAAPTCPWTVPVDVSGLADADAQQWSASAKDPAGTADGGSVSGPAFRIDTTAPALSSVGATMAGPHTVEVTASSTDSDVAAFNIGIADADGNSVAARNYPASGQSITQDVDVSSLDDGQLTVTVEAVDQVGNTSAAKTAKVTKNEGLQPNLDYSTFSSNAGDTTFTAALTRSVQSAQRITVHFDQPIKASYTPSVVTGARYDTLQIRSTAGNVVYSKTTGDTTAPLQVANDHDLVLDVPTGVLTDGESYQLSVTAYSKNLCADNQTTSCVTYDDLVRNPADGTPLVYTVDDVEHVTLDAVPEVTPSNVHALSLHGTSDPDTKTVQVLLAVGGQHQVVNATVGDGGAWSTGPTDVSTLPDGPLTVRATATDAAGNIARAYRTSTMAAHPSSLTARVSTTEVTYGHGVLVSGRLTDESGAPIAGAPILVTRVYDDGRHGKTLSATTDSTGHYGVVDFPPHNARFLVSYAGTTTAPIHDAATTRTARVLVRVALRFTSPADGATVGQHVTLQGVVAPNKAGAVVRIYRHTASGDHLLAKVTVTAKSRWSLALTLAKGRYAFRAVIGATAGNAGNRTGLLHLVRS